MPTDVPMAYYGCSNGLMADSDNVLVYPANTYVRIVGNRRTQASLMGQEGRVIKTVGLGGWHWLELNNGMTVKVQRNALCLADDVMDDDGDDTSTPSDRSSTHGISSEMDKMLTTGGIHLNKLSTAALLRYVRVHGLHVDPRLSRSALLKNVYWHFEATSTDETSVFTSLKEKQHYL